MTDDLKRQADYWDRQSAAFDAIYTHRKSAVSNLLDRLFRGDVYGRYRFVLDRSRPVAGRTFLDVGCGGGRYAVVLAAAGAGRVCGIDISPVMLDNARLLAAAEGVAGRCEFRQADVLGYEPDVGFDVVLAIGLLDYTRDPLPVLRKLHSWARDRVVVSFPRLWTWRAPVRKARLALKGCPVFFYTRRSVESLLAGAGFPRFTVEAVGKLFCAVASAGPARPPIE